MCSGLSGCRHMFLDTAEAFEYAKGPEGSRRQTCDEAQGVGWRARL